MEIFTIDLTLNLLLSLVVLTHMTTCSSESMDSSILNLLHTNTHVCDFEIPLKSFRSPLVVDLVIATSTTPNLEFLQRILLIEDLIELWVQNPRSTIRGTRRILFSLLMIIFKSPKERRSLATWTKKS